MIPIDLGDLNPRKSRFSRRQRDSAVLRRSRQFTPRSELLEGRIALTAAITLTGAAVVNSSGTTLTTIDTGETIDILAKYTTTNLPTGASYTIDIEVDGLILASSPITSGAGSSGTQSWTYNSNADSNSFAPTPGANQVIVLAAPTNSGAAASYSISSFSTTFNALATQAGGTSYNPAQMRQAYGFNTLANIGSAAADGTGQTIAIVDAGNNPTSLADLDGFDKSMTLSTTSSETIYQAYGPASSFMTVYNQAGTNITADIANSGSNGVPDVDPGWYDEMCLDLDWAHSLAPGAKIDLIEAVSADGDNLDISDTTAATLPGVTVVSNSWGSLEYQGENLDDPHFITPSGHIGVTFLVSTGDSGAPGGYPAYSPTAIAVGGTQLTLASNAYGGETGWNFPTPDTLNNGSSSYSQTGSWSSASGGFSGTYSTAAGGSTAQAVWTVSNIQSETEVSTTWKAAAGNATNATYTIYDGSQSGGQILGTVKVDQSKAAVGTPDGGSQFVDLGNYGPSTGTLTIVLNAATANGTVVADAVGLADASADGGGVSLYEAEPSYQLAVQSTKFRTIPDVSFDGSVDSPVTINETGGLIYGVAGTSLACPCWAAVIAIVNQDRVAEGGLTLDSGANPIQALQGLYSLPTTDFHDITSGYNGFAAATGYDEDTGIGTPIVNLLVPDLAAFGNLNDLVVSSQPPGNVQAGVPFSFSVSVETPNGALVPGYNGPVTIFLGNDPGKTLLGGTTTVNAVNGVATFSGLTLDVAASGYTIDVSGTKLTTAITSPFNVIAAAPAKLVISSEPPANVTAGGLFGLTVSIEDSFGNIVANDTGSLTIALANNPGGSTLGGTLTVATANGVAVFSGLSLTKADSGYTFTISRNGLPSVPTTPITVNPAAAQELIIIQPAQTGVVAGSTFSLEIAIEDVYGNVETGNNTSTVSASLQFGSGPLQGSTTVTTVGGIANFSLVDDKAVTIALNFTSVSLSNAMSSYITISPAAASQLVVQLEPSPTATVGQPFMIQPVIYEEDPYGNLESGDNSSALTVALASGTGPLLGTTSAVITGGAVRFTNLADNIGETIKLKFTDGMMSATSTPIVVAKLIPTIAVSSSATTGTVNQPMTFSVAVGPASAGPIPGGSVSLLDGTKVLGSAILNASGNATFAPVLLPLGTQAITVKYSGDPINAATTSVTNPVYVGDLVKNDFDGDGKSDLAVFGLNPTYGKYGFTVYTSSSGFKTSTFFDNNGYGYGNAQSIPVVGDYFGDGRDSYALWTPNNLGGMTFTAISSVSGKSIAVNFGSTTAIPVVADIDGDGKDDFGVYGYLPGYGYAFDFLLSTDNFNANQQYLFNNGSGYGNAQSIPIVADFDGSGKAGFAVYTPSSTGATFAFVDPSTNTGFVKTISPSLVTANAVPMAVDYDGDGKADLALYGPNPAQLTQERYLILTAASGFNPSQAVVYNNNGFGYGNSFSTPVMADYDGTGKDDFGVFTPDFTGGMEFVFQYNQTGVTDIADFATLTEIPLTTSTYVIAKKVRGQ